MPPPLPKTPSRKTYTDLPVYGTGWGNSFSSWNDFDSVGGVKSVLNELEQGYFYNAAILVDVMRRDDRIAGCFATRVNGLLGSKLVFDSKKEDDSERPIAERAEHEWREWFPSAALGELFAWGQWLGVGIGELIWKRDASAWTPTLKVWHPRFLRWQWTTRTFVLQTEEGEIEVTPGDGRWIIYAPHGEQRGWMHGLIRALSTPWLIRSWSFRDWARYSEVHGLPIRKAVVPKDATEDEKSRFLSELAGIGSETTIRIPRGEGKGDSFDLELVQASLDNPAAFDQLIGRVDTSIAIAILGQNLTTEVKKGGSYAAASVHDRVRGDFLKADAESLSHCLYKQGLQPWAMFNYGDVDSAPLPRWEVEEVQDKSAMATALFQLGNALAGLKNAGLNVDLKAMAESYGIPLLDEALLPQHDPQLAADAKDAAAQQTIAGPPPEKPAKEPVTNSLSAKPRGVSQAQVEGQTYVDALADAHKQAAADVLSPDVETIRQVIANATDFESMRSALVKAFAHMKPKELARLITKASILADLTGRAVVLEDTGG